MGHFSELVGAHTLSNQFVPPLQVNFLEKLPKLVALQIFRSSYLSCGETLNHNTYHIIIRPILKIFFKTLLISQKTPKLVAKILATKFGFVPDCCMYQSSYDGQKLPFIFRASVIHCLQGISDALSSMRMVTFIQFLIQLNNWIDNTKTCFLSKYFCIKFLPHSGSDVNVIVNSAEINTGSSSWQSFPNTQWAHKIHYLVIVNLAVVYVSMLRYLQYSLCSKIDDGSITDAELSFIFEHKLYITDWIL